LFDLLAKIKPFNVRYVNYASTLILFFLEFAIVILPCALMCHPAVSHWPISTAVATYAWY
jgi:hypothetical protein